MNTKPALLAIERVSADLLRAFGIDAQTVKACEEMGELTTQLCKRLNGSPTTDEKIVDEIADVLITVMQLRHVYGESAVDRRILFKLDRTAKFISEEKAKAKTKMNFVAYENINKGDVCSLDFRTGAINKARGGLNG